MQQTEKLKLNLIETGDPISPAPINENTQALDGLVAGIAAEQHIFKLAEIPPLTTAGPISFDLSGVDMTQYDALFLILYAKNTSTMHSIEVNGTGSALVVFAENTGEVVDVISTVLMLPVGDSVIVKASSLCWLLERNGNLTPVITGGRFTLPLADIRTIAMKNSVYKAGSGGVVFGVKF